MNLNLRMPSAYQIDKQSAGCCADGAYFITNTVVEWVDLFIRDSYKQLIADSLNYCILKKVLLNDRRIICTVAQRIMQG